MQSKSTYNAIQQIPCTIFTFLDSRVESQFYHFYIRLYLYIRLSWNVMAHGDAQEGKWRGNWRMEWVASTLHTTSEHGVSSITTADVNTSAASSWLNWWPRQFKWTLLFYRKTKSCFCTYAITFQLAFTIFWQLLSLIYSYHFLTAVESNFIPLHCFHALFSFLYCD